MTRDNCQRPGCGHGKLAHDPDGCKPDHQKCACPAFTPVAAPNDEWAEDRAGHAWDVAAPDDDPSSIPGWEWVPNDEEGPPFVWKRVGAREATPEDYTEDWHGWEAQEEAEARAAREAAPDDTALICCPACGNQRWEWLVPPNPTGEWNLECECGHKFTWVAQMHPAPAREAAQAEATLTDDERARMVDAICEGRVRNCRGTVENWGPAEDEAETHALLIRVLRGESEGFVRDVTPIVESILADRLAGRGHE